MNTPYTLRQRINPQHPENPMKFFPAPYYFGTMDFMHIAEDISKGTTLTRTDIIAVIQSFIMQIPKYMEMGYISKLDGFGSFKLAFSGEGKESPADVNARDIDDVHILFTPDIKLRRLIKTFKFSRIKDWSRK